VLTCLLLDPPAWIPDDFAKIRAYDSLATFVLGLEILRMRGEITWVFESSAALERRGEEGLGFVHVGGGNADEATVHAVWRTFTIWVTHLQQDLCVAPRE